MIWLEYSRNCLNCQGKQGTDCAEEVKLNSQNLHTITIMNAKTILGAIAIAVLFFFGIIFAWSSAANISNELRATRLVIATMLFVVGFGIAYYISKQPKTIIQQLEVSGDMKAVALKCPNCSASVDAKNIKIMSGVPYATCPYCGHTFEVAEEPKW
jgi:DNA-directed RNA polymerase subunit RPC12/RpoP